MQRLVTLGIASRSAQFSCPIRRVPARIAHRDDELSGSYRIHGAVVFGERTDGLAVHGSDYVARHQRERRSRSADFVQSCCRATGCDGDDLDAAAGHILPGEPQAIRLRKRLSP